MSDTILDVQGLTVEFETASDTESENVIAVNNVSFQLKRGETIGIVGESGSGKSVTSLAIMGLVPNPPGKVTGGRIIF